MILGTSGVDGADNSPRGDMPGFVKVADERTLLIPDRRGNNRLDALQNILRNPQVGLLFLVPGATETFRVNGEAFLTQDPAITELFTHQGKTPRTVIVVRVQQAYIHCSRALLRADLWNPEKFVKPGELPSFGTVMQAHTCGFVDANGVDEENKLRLPVTLY
jgi:PPOX class probable FMN-dependent enzyme